MKETFLDALSMLFATEKHALAKPKGIILFSLLKFTLIYILIKKSLINNPQKVKIFGYEYFIGDFTVFYGIFIDEFIKCEYSIKLDKKKPTIIDFGSHIGMSILYFKILFPHATIIGVEPDKKTYALLKKNIAKNFPDVVIYNKAVAGKAGKLKLYAADRDGDWGNANVEWGDNTNVFEVDAIVGSELIHKHVDILKIDIEGAEYDVLKELSEKGKLSLVDKIVLEYHQFKGLETSTLDLILGILRENKFNYFIDYHLGRSVRKLPSMTLAEMYGSVYSNLVYAVRGSSRVRNS